MVEFYFSGYLDNETVDGFIQELIFSDAEDDSADWIITLNSNGGDCAAGVALYDTIRLFELHNVTIIASGECCSMATLVVQAADRRLTTLLTTWMFHSSIVNFEEKSLRQATDELTHTLGWDYLADKVIVEKSSIDVAELHERISQGDWWMTGQDALHFGFVDGLV